MATGSPSPSLPVRMARGVRRTGTRLRRGLLRTDGFTLLVLAALVVLAGTLAQQVPQWVPPSAVVVIVLIGGFTLSPRSLVVLLVVVAAELAWLVGRTGLSSVRQGN